MATTKRIGFLCCDDPAQLSMVGPLEVFREANFARTELGKPAPYELELLLWRWPVMPNGLWAQVPYKKARPVDTLIVCAGRGRFEAARDPKLLDWLRAVAPETRRVCTVCTSVFVLAATGLLDGRRVTTHWKHTDELKAEHPRITVEPDPIFVRDGDVFTSAGVTAGMDLALALLEDDLGRDVSLAVARRLVVFLRRPGSQSQFSAQLAGQLAQRDPLRDAQHHIAEHPSADLSVAALARRVGMSERNFARCFRDEVGMTPARFVEQTRIETARRLLEETDEGVEAIARTAGFGTAETMRRTFLRVVRISPNDYRKRFAA